jgi:glycerol-3-phosphate dehydrogenase
MKLPEGISTFNRSLTFQEITIRQFDILVIGGGIMGAGIALDAASRNMKVLLVEKQDFAAGTSSRSTKLIHGGLRYLKNLEFSLVKTVASERQILHRNAPHLVLPEPMLLPVLKKNSYGLFLTKIGLALYDWLGNVPKPERHRMLTKNQTLQQEPLLNAQNLKGAGYFTEYRTDDSRLTIEVLKTAQQFGSICLNYTELTSFTYSEDNKVNGAILLDKLTGKSLKVKAKCIINASGAWTNKVLQQDLAGKAASIIHTKGVHLVVPHSRFSLKQAVYFDIPGRRMLFAIPRHEVTYFGTTDTPFSGKLENPEVNAEDVNYLLEQVNQMFPAINLKPKDIISSWAGVRTLLFEAGKKPSEISRKDEVYIADSGLITVAGGKLTGYRHLAETVINKAIKAHFPDKNNRSETKNIKLSGGGFENTTAVKTFLVTCLNIARQENYSEKAIRYLVQTYGKNTEHILQQTPTYKTENSTPETNLLKAEIWYTIFAEGVTNLSDFLVRRTGKLYFDRTQILAILPEVTKAFQEFLNWDEATVKKHTEEFMVLYEAAVAF